MKNNTNNSLLMKLPADYKAWRESIASLIEEAKLNAIMQVNAELLSLYWHIGQQILEKQTKDGWGTQVVTQLSKDLASQFPNDRGYSERNLNYMLHFARNYHSFPILQVPLAKLDQLPLSRDVIEEFVVSNDHDETILQVPLAKISWYHHISLLSRVKDDAERAFYIIETARNGWSRDTMLSQVNNGYIRSIGQSVNNFKATLPAYESDLAKYAFKDPYNFSFLGTVGLQNELDIERSLTQQISEFLLEMGKGFAYIGRQYHLTVDGDDYYIDLLMYHLKLHCYVVVELKAVEFIPEFVSKLNFYMSAVDEYVKSPEDKPTIGLLLCRTKSDTKARFALRGITQPMGIAQYEIEKLVDEVKSSLPNIDEIDANIEQSLEDKNVDKTFSKEK